jgi:hypothetical protein
MLQHYHYATVSEALQQLRSQGFTVDFNIEDNVLACEKGKFAADDFDVTDVYRYEGNTDPADEATVYAIQSKSGVKGVLVTGYGMSAENTSPELLKKLHLHNA